MTNYVVCMSRGPNPDVFMVVGFVQGVSREYVYKKLGFGWQLNDAEKTDGYQHDLIPEADFYIFEESDQHSINELRELHGPEDIVRYCTCPCNSKL